MTTIVHLFSVAVLSVALFQCGPADQPSASEDKAAPTPKAEVIVQNHPVQDDPAINAVIVGYLSTLHTDESLVVRPEPLEGFDAVSLKWFSLGGSPVDEENTPFHCVGGPRNILSAEDAKEMAAQSGANVSWRWDSAKIGAAPGNSRAYAFSVPQFNHDHTLALFKLCWLVDDECLAGESVLMKKANGRWVIQKSFAAYENEKS